MPNRKTQTGLRAQIDAFSRPPRLEEVNTGETEKVIAELKEEFKFSISIDGGTDEFRNMA